MPSNRKKHNRSFGIIFWIAVIALTAIVFITNRDNIRTAIDASNIRQAIGTRGADTQNSSSSSGTTTEQVTPGNSEFDQALRKLEQVQLGEPVTQRDAPDTPAQKPKNEEPTVADKAEQPVALVARNLYFINVDENGNIIPIRVTREVEKSTAPMSQSIRLLIAGLNEQETTAGLLNLIPAESQLLSASIKDRVAYLNFNDQFRYNPLGKEGIVAQLTQVVYSVTEFPTIEQVQILIEGREIEYLNSESTVYLKEPIGRDFLI